MEKVFLTKTGLFVQRDEQYFFIGNDFTFRRMADAEEAEWVKSVAQEIQVKLPAEQVNPDWTFVCVTIREDDSEYDPRLCNNGGAYSYVTKEYYFARKVWGQVQFLRLDWHDSSAEFPYNQMSGNFGYCGDWVYPDLVADDLNIMWLTEVDKTGDTFRIVADRLGTFVTEEEVLKAPGRVTIPDRHSDDPIETIEPDIVELALRMEVIQGVSLKGNRKEIMDKILSEMRKSIAGESYQSAIVATERIFELEDRFWESRSKAAVIRDQVNSIDKYTYSELATVAVNEKLDFDDSVKRGYHV